MKVKDILWLIVIGAFLWCVLSVLKPYWDRHWLGEAVGDAAIYGTKNTIPKTRKFLTKKMKEEGWEFSGDDFVIEKDTDNTVTIRITYGDEIRLFGYTVRELEFTVEETQEEVEELF